MARGLLRRPPQVLKCLRSAPFPRSHQCTVDQRPTYGRLPQMFDRVTLLRRFLLLLPQLQRQCLLPRKRSSMHPRRPLHEPHAHWKLDLLLLSANRLAIVYLQLQSRGTRHQVSHPYRQHHGHYEAMTGTLANSHQPLPVMFAAYQHLIKPTHLMSPYHLECLSHPSTLRTWDLVPQT